MERYTLMIMYGERAYLCHSDFNGQMISEALHCISDELNFYLVQVIYFKKKKETGEWILGEEVQEEDFFNNILLLKSEKRHALSPQTL